MQVIHDELELKGWESPVVMLLYHLALTADRVTREEKNIEVGRVKAVVTDDYSWIDPRTWDYHGMRPKEICEYNGYRTMWPYFTLKKSGCAGICGPGCKTCWKFVCGDCCYHLGCTRHDK